MKDMSTNQPVHPTKAMAIWLLSCCALIFIMVIVGAITRLTESGLSMVEWRPLIGAIPPRGEAEWLRVFELYKASPEYTLKNSWMTLSDFQSIFFWEWFHRLLGRLIGMVYALPLLFFWIRGKIPASYKAPLFLFLLLGAAQGYMGWFMVQSGLVDKPSVSHYRLAAHLALAFLLYCLLLKTALTLLMPGTSAQSTSLTHHLWGCLWALIITIFWGAYTAGLDAGLIYNDTFPKMGDHWIPEDFMRYHPFFVNFFENHSGVQLAHRWLAITTTLLTLSFWFHAKAKNQTPWPVHALGMMILLQFSLGVATLLSHVHLHIAVTHQAGALITLSLMITALHKLSDKKEK